MARALILGAAAAAVLTCLGTSSARGQPINLALPAGAGLRATGFAAPDAAAASHAVPLAPAHPARAYRTRRRIYRARLVRRVRRGHSGEENLAELRKSLTLKLEAINRLSPQEALPLPPPPPPPEGGAVQPVSAGQVAPLTDAATDGTAAAANPVPVAQAEPPRPPCPPTFDMTGWKGKAGFLDGLQQHRRQIALSNASAASLAGLAEFYLGYGMAPEAIAVGYEALEAPVRSPALDRLVLDLDLARLAHGTPIGTSSPLLTNPATCDRPDLALWKALSAAAGHDAAGVQAAAPAAIAELGHMPEPLQEVLGLRIAGALPDSAKALEGIADALRNYTDGMPQDEAERLLIEARIAIGKGDRADAIALLKSVIRMHVPGSRLRAEARLVELESAASGAAAPGVMARLADIARVYRDNAIGQRAAVYLAKHELREGHYAAALAIADQSASSEGAPRLDSRGAALIARILRTLLVDTHTPGLPPAAERAALFIRYRGYATPGPKGDDIRLGAAQLLLQEHLPHIALEITRQLSDPLASTPAALVTHARAEMQAGDPAVALLLLRQLPTTDATRRIAAEALARMGRPDQAAEQLDGLTAVSDRLLRARLLADAKDWSDAAAAYADVLHDPALQGFARTDALDRYSLAVALSGSQPDASLPLPAGGLAARVLGSLPVSAPKAGGRAMIFAVRNALQRAREVQSLLPGNIASGGS